MSLDAPRLGAEELVDLRGARPVESSQVSFHGHVWDVLSDRVRLGERPDSVVTRDYISHPGAVLVAAVRDDRDEPELCVIRQYRHPVAAEDWELPAGLLDVEGESLVTAAQRELAEEVDLQAAVWEELLRFTPSPGSLGEEITVFLATGLSEVPEADRHEREHEEAGMPVGWVSLPDAVAAVLGGQVRNGPLMLTVLALHARGSSAPAT